MTPGSQQHAENEGSIVSCVKYFELISLKSNNYKFQQIEINCTCFFLVKSLTMIYITC